MICGNCGFQNAPGDEFCGSCGQFLAWTGTPEDATRTAAAGASGQIPPAPQAGALPPGSAGPPPAGPPPAGAPPPPPPVPSNPGINWPAGLQRCDVCGTANELSRTFCLNCGAKLKKAGTTTGTALAVAAAQEERRRGMRMVGYTIIGLVILVATAAIAFVALGGLAPAAPAATATPPATLVAVNPSGSLPPAGSPTATLPVSSQPPATLVASNPTDTLPPATSPPATPPPPGTPPPATSPPATVPPAGGFVCSASPFSASQPGGWKIVRAHWSRKGPADTLALEMEASSSGSTAGVDVNILPPDQVQPTYGVPGPSSGTSAVVLSFNDAVTLSGPFGSPVGYKALQEFQIYRSAGRVIVVMGVNGSGCYGLASEAWATGSSSAPELDVAIQH